MIIGYARTSTLEQQAGMEAQQKTLSEVGCEKIYSEQVSSVARREALSEALGEALAIEWPDIDLNEKEIDNYNFKTGKSVFVPISDRVAEMLSRIQEQDRPFTSMDRAVKNLREAIRVMCPSTHRVLNEKGKATIHSCRDTYATRMLKKGMKLEEVSHLLGHATVQQTQKYAKYANRPVAAKAREYLNSD